MNFVPSFFNPSDGEILNDLLKEGPKKIKAEEQLFNRYAYFIKEGIYKYSLSEEESFDAYTDAVLAALEKISKGSYEGKSSLKTWLYQIFHNKIVDLLRKKTTNKSSVFRTHPIEGLQIQISDTVKSVIQKLIDKTDVELLKSKLNQLGDDCRQMLQKWAEGYSDKEIAVALHYKTPDVAKTSRLRCLEKLKRLYKSG